jgi:hypothetical protein
MHFIKLGVLRGSDLSMLRAWHLVPSLICTFVQMYVQDCALVEIRRFDYNGTRNILTLLSSLLASMVECMGLSPG